MEFRENTYFLLLMLLRLKENKGAYFIFWYVFTNDNNVLGIPRMIFPYAFTNLKIFNFLSTKNN